MGNEEIWRFRETELGMTLSEIGRLQVSEPEPDTTNESQQRSRASETMSYAKLGRPARLEGALLPLG